MASTIIKGPTAPRPLPHGNNQQSPAVQHLIGTVYGGFGSGPRRKRALGRRKPRSAASSNGSRARASTRKKGLSQRKGSRKAASKKGRPARLVKGSAAAKRYMASIRPK